jgi:hypothetical protein
MSEIKSIQNHLMEPFQMKAEALFHPIVGIIVMALFQV